MRNLLLLMVAFAIATLTACNEKNTDVEPMDEPGTSRLIVKLTDDPALFDSVNVEILQVAVNYCGEDNDTTGDNLKSLGAGEQGQLKDGDDDECDSTQFSGWVDLETVAGIYNLLELQNNVTAVLVEGDSIPAGHITQMRLLLGENNYLVDDTLVYDLKTPSGQQSGLKINLNADFEENHTYEIVLDFDAEQSIVHTGNDKYILKPVIKVLSVAEIN